MPAARGKASAAAAGGLLIIIYCCGLAYDTWMVAYERMSKRRSRVIANVGLFSACGYDINLQVLDEAMPKDCFSLLVAGVPGWVRAVQFFAIMCLVLLCVASVIWCCIILLGKLTETRIIVPFFILWTITGLFSLVHPVVFACNMRPGDLVTGDEDSKFPHRYTFYWGAFYLHCVAAGFMNLFTLIGLCCFCLVKYG
ncbi:uncharacterized protein LOC124291348 [Haliotis rubra]|uniref:uncharacterized protein LOC124291348 n=1 Tax=Haliotis rubra TaxID=36100 RepID=UPI001EE5F6DE|nr:uncharacterized protein LOC124291348 [Haliotis rubra]XP_046584286.1 uncharacterized protein LOC124291348 [Haliotis rubra]